VLEFLNNLWGQKPSRKRVFVPARQATKGGGIDLLESILGLLRSLKIRAQRDDRKDPNTAVVAGGAEG
jgi:hypothetical protein